MADEHFEPLYTAAEMRALEEAYPGFPDTMDVLMERAGRAVAEELRARYPHAGSALVVCGGGSNGGDGRVAAIVLEEAGLLVRRVDLPREEESAEMPDLGAPDVVVDALFGTGFSGTPRANASRLIEQVNALGVPVVAVDVPSGVDASTGQVAGEAVQAELTVTFAARKLGQLVSPGRGFCGHVVVADIGLDPGETAARRVLPAVLREVPLRSGDANKYSSGAVVVVGGSPGLTGAVCLAAEAALRADAGYVSVVAPASSVPILEVRLLEPVKRAAREDDAGLLVPEAAELVLEEARRARAVVLGPGIGRSDGVRALVRELLATLEIPVVLDADALFGLTPGQWRAPVVLTPHSGELARLLGADGLRVASRRLEAARACAERFGAVTLLKGPDTLVVGRDGRVVVADHGPPSLATAGTGDVLSGVLGAFLAKGLDPELAAAAAATAHGLAAQAAPQQAGLVASDLVRLLPGVLGA